MTPLLSRRDVRIRTVLTLFVMAVPLARILADGPIQANPAPLDCGMVALFHLLRLEGFSVELPRVESRLPASPRGGNSMKDLRLAARAFGMELTGVAMPKDGRAIDRPIIMFLKRGPHGHFLVVRPVGHTGKLVQVIDSVAPPAVIDKAELSASPEWTGLALVPDRPNVLVWAAGGVVVLCAAAAKLAWAIPKNH